MQIANCKIIEVNAVTRRFRYFDLSSFIFALDSRQRTRIYPFTLLPPHSGCESAKGGKVPRVSGCEGNWGAKGAMRRSFLCKTKPIFAVLGPRTRVGGKNEANRSVRQVKLA